MNISAPRPAAELQPVRTINVLGVGISVLNLASARERIAAAIAAKKKGYICVTGVHGVSEAQTDPEFRRVLNRAFLCTPDGMPLVWLGKYFGYRTMGRVYGPDLMLEVCAASAGAGWRHFFYGGAPGVAEKLKEILQKRFPGLEVAGAYTPPFRPLNGEERAGLIEQVRRARADILWVGLSTPKQEKFMAEILEELDVTLMIGVGAAFDFHSGQVRQAPRWIQRSGFEWLYRLGQEPRRLWRRYLKNNPLFLARIACQLSGWRKYPLE